MNTTLPTKTSRCNRRNFARSILINLSIILTLLSLQTSGQISVSGGTGLAATYASFTNAGGLFAALNSNAQTGNNIVVTITADITTEAGTNSLNAGVWATINITPVGTRIVSGTVAGNPMINLNGADNVTFNGLNSGGNSLTLSNLSTSSTSGTGTIRFIGGATNNNFTNCSILGSTTVISTTNGGVIFFSTDGSTPNGNDNNIFTSCNIGAAGSNLPSKLVYGNGSTTNATIANSGNQFNSCNFSDAFLTSAIWNYVSISSGNTDWTFNNNKFYSSAIRTQTTGTDNSIIRISNTTNGNNFQITNNTFGFANESGTGTFSVAGGANKFSIINVSVATTTATNISNNTISNISHSTTTSGTTSSSPFILIYVQSGLTTVNNNIIGSQSATGSITFTSSSTSASDLNLIYNFGSSNWTTNNNTLGGVTVANSSTGAANLFALRCNTGSSVTWTCNNNTIGGTVSNSLQSTSTSTSTTVRGITTENPVFSCNGNIIRNLSMLAANTATGTSSSIIGIFHNTNSNIGNTISNNTIHSLANNSATGATSAVGLYYGGATSGTNTISRNLIYNIHLATSSTGGSISGITTNNGLTVFHNNMIRLGFDLSGNSQTVGYSIIGINDLLGTNNFFFNSVYIGGSSVVSSSTTFAFNSTITSNTRVFQNNIFYNGRSNASGTGKNYAIRVGGSAANPSGLTTNYNVVLANGTGGVLGLFNGIDRTDLAAWKLATGQDANSLSADPQFLSPNATTPDLHINSVVATPIEAAGLLVASITNDFDNETRSTLTPTDIGADAGNFTAAPTMTYSSSNVTQVVGSACAGNIDIAVVRLEIVTTGVLSPLTLTNWSINGNGTSNIGDLTNYRIYSTGNNPIFNTSTPVSAIGTGLTSSPDVVVTPLGTVTLSTGSNYFWLVYNTTNVATGPNLDGEFTSITLSSGLFSPTTTAPAGVFTLNLKPTVTLSPSTASYCNPGGAAVTLNAGGALTYTYSPTTALSPTTGATVSATPSTTVTYTVTGTDLNGCTNTAVSTISVLPGISGLSASSTPSIICNGSTTDLNSTITNSNVAKNYTFSSGSSASLDAMASSTIVVGSGVDDAPMALSGSTAGASQPIGFTFSFEGITYTHFSASPDGWIRLTNSTASIASEIANAMNSSVNIPKITPFWDDIATGTNGNVKIQINGVAPNRIFIVQWFVTIPRNTSGTANSTFQAWLYEGNNNIEFRYGTLGIPANASAGITGLTTTNFQSITFSNNTNSFTTSNNSNSISPASGTIYTYTPASFSFLWNTTPSITLPNTQDVTTNAISANETFTVVATSSVGCTASANTSVTVSDNPAITTQPTSLVRCAGQNATFNVVATGVGLTYQWRKNGVNINTTTNTSAATATLSLTNVSTGDADNYDVVVSASCGTPVTSSSVSLTVNALPVVTISATNSGLICNPSGTAISLTASNASTYVWSPATGLSATNLETVSANPTTTQLYTVIGTDGNGCTGSATLTVTVANKPIVTATSTPSTICSGTNSQLLATSNSLVNSYQFSNSTTTYNEITTGTLMLSTNNDDDELFNNNLTGSTTSPLSGTGFPIGFNFGYNSLSFDKFAISTNGYIVLGTGTFSIASSTTTALSTGTNTGYANLIAAWNQDLGGQTGAQIQYLTTGSIGSRILTVQWKGYTRLSNSANLNFQIKLYEGSNKIEFAYGSNTITSIASFGGGVGLRGATNAFTNIRTTTTDWAATTAGILNTETCTMSNTLVPASGTLFTFSQPNLSSYSWSPTTFITSGDELTANPIAIGVNAATTYTVSATNAAGCTATASTTVSLATPVTITTEPAALLTRCVGQSSTFTVVASGTGLTYQWRKNSVAIPVGTNASAITASLVIPNVVSGDADVYDVIVTDACSNSVTSQQSTLVVNGLPTVTLTTSTPSYFCSPGGTAVTLTASGASTYSYSPSTGLTPTTGSPVAATPTTTTTYTVTGTDVNGCTSQASALVTVNVAVQNLSATATPSSICTGGTSSLFANGLVPFTANNYAFATETEALLDPMTGATTIIGSSVANAPSSIAPIGFNFSFEGNSYTHYSVSPDGWLMFGTSSTTTPGNQTGNSITSGTNVPKIYPYWDNIQTSTNGGVRILITGTAPNRIFKVQWAVNLQNQALTTDGTFQAWLYETTGVIEYRYGTMATPGGTVSAGLTGSTSTNYESITFSTHTASSSSANDNNAVSPSSGRLYRFTPPSSLTYAWTATTNLLTPSSQTTLTNALSTTETFTVVATATSGCSASATATVTVSDNPVITTQPAPINSCSGNNVSFTVVTTGIGLTYQWQKDLVDISIGTNASAGTPTLNLSNVSSADDGIYTVVITSGCGTSITSNGASTLTANALPNVTLTASNNTFCSPGGTPVVLTAGGASTYTYSPATNLSATTGATVNASPTVNRTYTVTGTDANGCTATANQTISVVAAPTGIVATATPSALCPGGNSQLNVTVANIPGSGDIKITEVMLSRVGTGVTTSFPSFATGADLVEISNISSSNVDISGWVITDYNSNSATLVHTLTFPSGTIIPANDVAIVCLGTGTDDIPNRYYNTGGIENYSSGALMGIVLKNGSTIVDAVGLNSGFVFAAGTGVTAADWSGFAPSDVGFAGTIRSASGDSNTEADWIQSSVGTPQSIGTYNSGYSTPTTISSYAWSPSTFISSATNIQNPTVAGITSQTNYTVAITTSNGCTVNGNVTVNLLQTPSFTLSATPASVCNGESVQLNISGITGGGNVPVTFANTASIDINDNAISNPYPATISSVTGLISGATVKSVSILGLSHDYPNDIDMILVSPTGQHITLMSDAGGSSIVEDVNLVFQDGSSSLTSSSLVSGTYSPTDLGTATDIYPAPASINVASPITLPLTTFTGNLNGNWSLYIVDDADTDFGFILDGFSITFNNPTSVSYSWSRNTAGTINTPTTQNPTAIVNTPTTFSATVTNTETGCFTTQSINVGVIAPPQPKLTQSSQSICAGEELLIGVIDTGSYSGGYPPNTKVDWYGDGNQIIAADQDFSTTISSTLSSNFYAIVKLPGNTCIGTSNVVSISNVQLSLSAIPTNASCLANSGSILATATGIGPYTYVWKNSSNTIIQTTSNSASNNDLLSGLNPGTYSVTVTGNSDGSNSSIPTCTSSPSSATVGSVTSFTLNVTSSNQSCPSIDDGTATAIPSNGVGPYTYNWNSGAYSTSTINSLAPGVYSVTVTDNGTGCIQNGTATIVAAPQITSAITTTNISCNGLLDGSASVDFTGSPANVIAYEWQDSNSGTLVNDADLTNVGAGTYYVYALDENGCNSLSNAVVITEPAAVIISSLAPSNGLVGSSVVITGSGFTGATAVLFNGVAASYVVDNSTTITATVPVGASNGNITVTVNGICTTVSTSPFTVNPSTVTLNLNVFIQGFYLGGGLMPAILFDQGMETDPTACDYITVELYEGLTPSNPAVSSTTTILHTDGTAQITLPAGINGGDYYIAIKHRNTIETWSKNPVTFTSVTTFDFTN